MHLKRNIFKTPDEYQRPKIPDQFHKEKNNLYRVIIEIVCPMGEKYYWQGLTKDLENIIKICETCPKKNWPLKSQ